MFRVGRSAMIKLYITALWFAVLAISSCTEANVEPRNKELLQQFTAELRRDSVSHTSAARFLDSTKFSNQELQTWVLTNLSRELRTAQSVTLYTYAEAQRAEENIPIVQDATPVDNIMVIKLCMPDGEVYRIYIMFKENKIYSCSAIKRGKYIVGWL